MSASKRQVVSHLKGDIKGYKKDIKHNKEEMSEDKGLIKKLGGKMKKQGYNSRLDESLGERNKGKKKQSLKSRRDESKGMEKAMGKRAYSGDKEMDMISHHLKAALKAHRAKKK